MKDPKPDVRPETDGKPTKGKHGGVPMGTHSLTGGGSAVGMPPRGKEAERGEPAPDLPHAEDPEPSTDAARKR